MPLAVARGTYSSAAPRTPRRAERGALRHAERVNFPGVAHVAARRCFFFITHTHTHTRAIKACERDANAQIDTLW